MVVDKAAGNKGAAKKSQERKKSKVNPKASADDDKMVEGASAGNGKYLFEFANIRGQCSWVHMNDWDTATAKAKDLVRMSVMRAALLQPLKEISIDINPACLVVGAGIGGMSSALSIAGQGYEVFLVEKEAEVGGMMRNLHTLAPTDSNPGEIISRYLKRVSYCSRICFMVGIKNAIALKEKFPKANVSFLHNDIEVYGVI